MQKSKKQAGTPQSAKYFIAGRKDAHGISPAPKAHVEEAKQRKASEKMKMLLPVFVIVLKSLQREKAAALRPQFKRGDRRVCLCAVRSFNCGCLVASPVLVLLDRGLHFLLSLYLHKCVAVDRLTSWMKGIRATGHPSCGCLCNCSGVAVLGALLCFACLLPEIWKCRGQSLSCLKNRPAFSRAERDNGV